MIFLKKILKKKWTLKTIKKVDIIVFHNQNLIFLNKFNFINYDNSKLFLIYSFEVLLKYFNQIFSEKKLTFSQIYHYTLLKKYDCKVAIGHDRGESIFMFKKMFPKKISIAYQFGYWFNSRIKMGLELLNNKTTDYYLVFDERTKKLSESKLKSKYIISGSIQNNEKKTPNKNKKFDFMLISTFRANMQETEEKKHVVNYLGFVLSTLSEFCNKNKKSFCIAGVYTRKDKKNNPLEYFNQEKSFYKKNAQNFEIGQEDAFNLADQSEVCICTHSNLGYQLLSRGKKVIFLNTEEDLFTWHFIEENHEGKFWHKGRNKFAIFKKFEEILRMSNKNWAEILKNSNTAIKFDPGNKILEELLYKILYTKNI